MKYTQAEFFRLMEAIEDQGGEHQDAVCEDRFFTRFVGDKIKGQEIAYCGEQTLFDIPYVGLDKFGDELPIQPITVCAVDDMVGRWPRFAAARAEGRA